VLLCDRSGAQACPAASAGWGLSAHLGSLEEEIATEEYPRRKL